MKKVIAIITILFLLLAGGATAGFMYYRNIIQAPFKDGTPEMEVTIKEGETLNSFLERLNADGKLRNFEVTKLFYRLSGKNLHINAGKHVIPEKADLNQLLSALKTNNLDTVPVTIPEGYTIDNIAKRLEEKGIISAEDFKKAAASYDAPSYVPEIGERRYRLEGYLKPDTYSLEKNMEGSKIIDLMVRSFEKMMKVAVKDSGNDISQDKWDEIVTKASMIEREVSVPEERAIVASVIENRLKEGMKLQIDATILYARGVDTKEITMDDILFENPFNTYYVDKLPAGPICNPSKESLMAALKPDKTDYIYYVANPDTGRHFFTKDYDEFNRKRDEYINGVTTTAGSTTPAQTIPETTVPVTSSPENTYQGPDNAPGGVVLP